MHILIAALIGVVISVGITLVVDAIRGRTPTGKELLASAIGGLVGGAITAATLGTGGFAAATIARGVTASIAGGAAGGGTGQVTANVADGRPLMENVPQATAVGGALGGGLYGLGRAAAPVLGKVLARTPVETGTAPSVPPASRGMRGALLGEEPGNSTPGEVAKPATPATPTASVEPAAKPPLGALAEAPQAKPGPNFPEARKPTAKLAEPDNEAPAATKPSMEAWKKARPEFGLKDPVADIAYFTKDVPALEGDLAALRAKGWQIKYGEPGKGSWANAEKVPPEIVIDPSGEPLEVFKTVAHEVGHANERPTAFRDPKVLSHDDYVATRLHDMALSEGQAVLNEANSLQALRTAVYGRTGEAPSLPYQGIYRTIAQNKSLSVDQKIEQIGLRYMQDEVPCVGSGEKNYNGYWSDLFAHEWNVAHGLALPD